MERLTAEDRLMLWPDERWPQDIGALAILDGARLLDPDGRFPIGAAREAVEARLPLVPRFRQVLHLPRRGLGGPLWEMWFLTGLPELQIGLFARIHHAIAAGIAGMATLGTFLDTTPAGPARPVAAPRSHPSGAPARRGGGHVQPRRHGHAAGALAD